MADTAKYNAEQAKIHENFPVLAVRNGIVISSSSDTYPDRSVPRSGQYAAEFFSAAGSLLFSHNVRKSGILPLYKGGTFSTELLFFDTFHTNADSERTTVLCGEFHPAQEITQYAVSKLLYKRIKEVLGDTLTDNECHTYTTRYRTVSSCFNFESFKKNKKAVSSPLHQIDVLNSIYKKRFKIDLNPISIKEVTPDAGRAELFFPPEMLCAIIFLSAAFVSRCIAHDPSAPGIKSNILFNEKSITLRFSAPAKDVDYCAFYCHNPIDAVKVFPSFSGELTALYRLCTSTDCDFSMSIDDGKAVLSYTFPSFIRRQRIRVPKETEAELEFYEILADFIL